MSQGLINFLARFVDLTNNNVKAAIVGSLANVLTKTGASGANAAQTLTIDAVAGQSHYIVGFEVVTKGANAGADIDVVLNDGATAKWQSVIGNGAEEGSRTGLTLPYPLKLTANTACTLVVDAGGASVITMANIAYYTTA